MFPERYKEILLVYRVTLVPCIVRDLLRKSDLNTSKKYEIVAENSGETGWTKHGNEVKCLLQVGGLELHIDEAYAVNVEDVPHEVLVAETPSTIFSSTRGLAWNNIGHDCNLLDDRRQTLHYF